MRDARSATAEETRNTGMEWLAFIARKEVVGNIIYCTPISSRLIFIQISARPHSITVIQVYAPTSDDEDKEVGQFKEQLDSIRANKQTNKKDILVA